MEYILKIDMVDVMTGEILTRSKSSSYNTDVPKDDEILTRYLESFKRGLRKGRSLALCITCTEYQIPVQLNLF